MSRFLLDPRTARATWTILVMPLVMARGIEIHPALVIVGVLAGGEIAGVAGMFLSVPIIAAVRIVWRRLQLTRAPSVDHREPDRPIASPRRL